MSIEKLIKLARIAVLAAPNGKRTKHVAVITNGGKLVAIGVNNQKSHPVAKTLKGHKFADTQCAELNACLKLGLTHRDGAPDFSKLTMYIVRLSLTGQLTMSKPCKGCQQLLGQCGFRRVYYSTKKGELEKL